jgi:hypothetical protein
MARKEQESKTFVNIKNDVNGKPQFIIDGKPFGSISGILSDIRTETKQIIPKQGVNA